MLSCRGAALVLMACALPRLAAQSQDLIVLTPASVAFSFQIGGALPAEQKVQVKRLGAGAAVDFTVTVPAGGALADRHAAGRQKRHFPRPARESHPAAGGLLHRRRAGERGRRRQPGDPVEVTLVVKNPPPTAAVAPAAVTVTFQTDQAAPAAQTLAVSTNGEPVSFTAAASGGAWVSVTPATGIAVAGSPVTLTVDPGYHGPRAGHLQRQDHPEFLQRRQQDHCGSGDPHGDRRHGGHPEASGPPPLRWARTT